MTRRERAKTLSDKGPERKKIYKIIYYFIVSTYTHNKKF